MPDDNKQFICISKGLNEGAKKSFILDSLGRVLLTTNYDALKIIEDRNNKQSVYFIAKKGAKYGIIDLKGKIILPFRYDELRTHWSSVLFYARKGNQKTFINLQGKFIANFDEKPLDIEVYINGHDMSRVCEIGDIYLLRLKDKTLIINKKGKIKSTIEATKVQQYLKDNRRLALRSMPVENPKLLQIEKDNQIWYYNYEHFMEYKK
jgi:hypothetical protein